MKLFSMYLLKIVDIFCILKKKLTEEHIFGELAIIDYFSVNQSSIGSEEREIIFPVTAFISYSYSVVEVLNSISY